MIKCRICTSTTRIIQKGLFDDRHGFAGRFDEYRCENCGFISIDPVLEIDKISKIYEEYYPIAINSFKNVEKFKKIPNKFKRFYFGQNNLPHYQVEGMSKDILDYGAGSGKHIFKLIDKHNVEGIDPDPKAKEEFKRFGITFYTGFYQDLPKEKMYDYILVAQVLEHEPDPKDLIVQLSKHLKENGKIILSFPHGDSLYRKIFRKRWIHWHVPYHLNLFTKSSLQKLVDDTNLKISTFRTITPSGWTSLQFYRLFSSVKEGLADPVWGKTGYKEKINPNKLSLIILILGRLNLQFIFNRIIDIFGKGDAVLLILDKNENTNN